MVNPVENRLSPHGRWNNHSSLNSVFPFADADLVKVEHQFCTGTVNMMPEAVDRCVKKNPRHFKPWVALWNTFGLVKLFGVPFDEGIDPSASNMCTESCRALV
jgi:hypothetical protein